MKKIKIKKYRKIRAILVAVAILGVFMLISNTFNRYMEPQLLAIAKQHAGFAINNIVKEVLGDLEYKSDDFLNIREGKNGEIVSIEYDSYKINQILYSSLNSIDKSLLAAQDGKKDPTTKNVFYENGVLYEVPAGYLTKIFFLYDKGPSINVRMKMLNDVTGEIKTTSTPYGINSTLLKITLVIHVDAQVITFLSTSELKTSSEIPLVIQVINGKVPSLAPYTGTQE